MIKDTATLVPKKTDGELLTGEYLITFDCEVPEILEWIVESFSGVLETFVEVVDGKTITILDAWSDGKQLMVQIRLNENPVPVALIVTAIIAVTIVGGGLLILNKVDEIIDSPAGTIVSIGTLFVIGLIFYFIYVKK